MPRFPKFKLPKIKLPKIKLPKIKLPKIKPTKTNIPDAPSRRPVPDAPSRRPVPDAPTRRVPGADDVKKISTSRRVGRACAENPMKCTAVLALGGYTAHTLVDNWGEQKECVERCLPLNWTEVVESNGEVAPDYFGETPSPGADDQPQCTEGMDCEQFCVSACKAEHPTTLFGAVAEGTGRLLDDVKDFAQDGLGIPVDAIGRGLKWVIGLVVLAVVLVVLRKANTLLKGRSVAKPQRVKVEMIQANAGGWGVAHKE